MSCEHVKELRVANQKAKFNKVARKSELQTAKTQSPVSKGAKSQQPKKVVKDCNFWLYT